MEQAVCPLTRGERILVAMDGSTYSDKALEQALSMARVCGSTLFAITVMDVYPATLGSAPGLEEWLSKEAGRILEKAKNKAAENNIPCETIVHIGKHPYEFIVREAIERDIDLIVMGTHGRTGLKKLLLGSVAERVIGHAPCAVLVTPV
jgi:nucleotide-binding universal stress UspA family protein